MPKTLLDSIVNEDFAAFSVELVKFKSHELDAYVTGDDETLLITLVRLSEQHNDGKKYLPYICALLRAGANVNERIGRNNILSGSTALMCATDAGLYAIAGELIDAGADVDAQDDAGFTALISICGPRRYRTIVRIGASNQDISVERCIQLLLEHTNDIDLATNEDDTALHYAVLYDPAIATMLLEQGAKIKRNSLQQTPMMFFANRPTISANGQLALLKQQGISPDDEIYRIIEETEIPQFKMESQLTSKLFSLLLKSGDKVENEDIYGRKALLFAKRANNQPFLELLVDTAEPHSYCARQYYAYFEKVFELVKSNLEFAESMGKRLVILIGEAHKEKRCLAAELIYLCVCHKLGIKNIVLELDESRAAECMAEIQSFAANLKLTLHFVDEVAVANQTAYGTDYKMSERNHHMYARGQKIGDDQLWVLGAAHLEGMQELFADDNNTHILTVNLTAVKDLVNGRQIINMPFPDHEQFIDSCELADIVYDCYKAFNSNHSPSRFCLGVR